MAKVVLITGPSGCGKSTMAKSIVDALGTAAVHVGQDDFFAKAFTPYSKAVDDRNERPDHVDLNRLRAEVNSRPLQERALYLTFLSSR